LLYSYNLVISYAYENLTGNCCHDAILDATLELSYQ
jgi:hypothetical protein